MPTDSQKRPVLLELPPAGNLADLQMLINDRIRDLNQMFSRYVIQPADADVDIGADRIINLADPKDDLDGVNLRTLRKFQGTAAAASQQAVQGLDAYAIVFALEGFSNTGQNSAAYDVNENREGSLLLVSLSALTAPVLAPLTVNPYMVALDGSKPNLLSTPLVLPVGQTKAVYSTAFAVPLGLVKGMKLVNVIVSGDAQDITTEIVVRRT